MQQQQPQQPLQPPLQLPLRNQNPTNALRNNILRNANTNNNQKIDKVYVVLYKLFLTKLCHLFSFGLLSILFNIIYYYISLIKQSDFSLKKFEHNSNNKHFYLFFWCINISLVIINWNALLFMYHTIYKYTYEKGTVYLMSTSLESFYNEPLMFIPLLYFLDETFLDDSIDNSFWLLIISTFYFITLNVFQFFKKFDDEINSINNFESENSKKLIPKIKRVSTVFIIITVLFNLFIAMILKSTNRFFKYVFLGKGIYIIMKVLELYITRKHEYNFMKYDINTKEKFYIPNLMRKTFFEIFIMMYVLVQILGIVSVAEYSWGLKYIISFIVSVYQIYKIKEVFLKYQNSKQYFKQLDMILKNKHTNLEEECGICTDKLIEARKLSCGHNFHLFCLGKWFESGNKTCPFCRKEVNTSENPNSIINNTQRRRTHHIRSFEINFNHWLFRWIPQINMRIIRTNNVPQGQ